LDELPGEWFRFQAVAESFQVGGDAVANLPGHQRCGPPEEPAGAAGGVDGHQLLCAVGVVLQHGAAEERWGDTDGWRQRQQRASTYSKQEGLTIRAEQAGIHQRLPSWTSPNSTATT
jgi:hypothetical protein